MTEVAAAAVAMHFLARDDQTEITRHADRALDRCEEARPPGAALELGVGLEQRTLAGRAMERAGPVLVVEGARKRPLGPMLAQHAELRRGEQPLPLVGGFDQLELAVAAGARRRQPLRAGEHGERTDAAEQEYASLHRHDGLLGLPHNCSSR